MKWSVIPRDLGHLGSAVTHDRYPVVDGTPSPSGLLGAVDRAGRGEVEHHGCPDALALIVGRADTSVTETYAPLVSAVKSSVGTATIVGGGPAGLMAAEVLASRGLTVAIYDHKPSVGRKFLLAGRGGLNITHSETTEALLDRYGAGRPHLEPALARFGQDDLRAWCAGLGEPTHVGSSGRVFPSSFRATPLLRAWLKRLGSLGVTFHVRHRWEGWSSTGANRFRDAAGADLDVTTDVTVLALGGASWPRVGADGTWVSVFERHGIAVEPLVAANGGICVAWTDEFVERFAGEPLKNTTVTVESVVVRGDVMVTDGGLEGGPVYAHSTALTQSFDDVGLAVILIDLWPDVELEHLVARLSTRRRRKDSASNWLRRSGFPPIAVSLLREATANDLPTDPNEMAALAKAVPIEVVAMMPIERAISTAGGVSFDEVDDRLMLRRVPGTFIAGEMLDWEAPTGGYLLQACFSTGVEAATGALAWLREH